MHRQQGIEADVEKKHTTELENQMTKCAQAMYSERAGETEEQVLERAMRDPEVANIMSDPIMQQVRLWRLPSRKRGLHFTFSCF